MLTFSQIVFRGGSRVRVSAFTLIEIVVVLALITTLMAIALPALRGARERSARAQTAAELETFARALEEYRHTYGDYPQTGDCAAAEANTAVPLTASHAQARLLNALLGTFPPDAHSVSDRINGRPLIDVTKFQLEHALPADFDVPTGSPPFKPELTNCLLDPWGRRYLYFYKSATQPGAWRANRVLLYSAGADGEASFPNLRTGLFAADVEGAAKDADNIWFGGLDR